VSAALLLGLDVGTTSTKAAVIDLDGAELSHGRAPMPWRAVPSGAEIAPEALLHSAKTAAAEALEQAPRDATVAAVGVSSMAETGVLLDRHGRPTGAPAIAWHDARGAREAERIAHELPAFTATTGLPPTPLCALAKLRWLRDHEPVARDGVRWLNVAEWVVKGLGGEETAELSLASRTGWLDVDARSWWDEALQWAGAPPGFLPALTPAGTPAGEVTELPAARGATLAIGGHDHLSAAVGAGAVGEGDVLDSSGTAEAFIRAIAPLPPERIPETVAAGLTVGWHAVPGRQCLLGAHWSGQALGRILDLLGHDRETLERQALDADPGDLAVSGISEDTLAISGIGRDASPAQVWRAALEAVGRGGADILARMAAVAGPHRRLVVAGGWAEGEAARAVKARWLGPFGTTAAAFAGARGAALTAGRGAGLEVPDPDTGFTSITKDNLAQNQDAVYKASC
jgi:sugar (pentulose or hexulose) kinase